MMAQLGVYAPMKRCNWCQCPIQRVDPDGMWVKFARDHLEANGLDSDQFTLLELGLVAHAAMVHDDRTGWPALV